MGIAGVEPPSAGAKETVSSAASEATESAETVTAETVLDGEKHDEL